MRSNPKLKIVEDILRRNAQELRHFVLSIVHSPTDAEDILQAGFIRCLEKAAQLKDLDKARSWVFSIFRNLALDFLRENRTNSLVLSNATPSELEMYPSPNEHLEESSICSCANQLLKELPEPYSHILNEVEIEGESVKELAKDLGYSPNRLSVQLHRARKSLKSALKEKCKVESYESCLECEC